jgi:4,5-DOPA dioxygenase extradiol
MTNKKMPVLFIGHGSPMNALASNDYTLMLNELGRTVPRPEAILMISAHWMTRGTWVTAMPKPRTIHDFGGFPKALFDVQYPAPGSPELAHEISSRINEPKIGEDAGEWGFDHGTWSILRHIYPKADIPVVQLSLDMTKPASFHYELGKKLAFLREKNVLIMASGNIVHNLRFIEWDEKAKPHGFAVEFDQWIEENTHAHKDEDVVNHYLGHKDGQLSNPTQDHYFPYLVTLGAAQGSVEVKTIYSEIQNASISMRSFMWN